MENVDALLVKEINQDKSAPDLAVVEAPPANVLRETPQPEVEPAPPQPEVKVEPQEKPIEPVAAKESPIDEYGNPIEPPKMYTQDEVNRMIRDRVARIKTPEQSPQPPTQQQPPAENVDNAWQQELEQFIDRSIDKRQAKYAEDQRRYQENVRQAQFEEKFRSGVSKYPDFENVVAGKPITDNMVLATRGLEDPAAFLYAASKLHVADLERIAKIDDAYTQAMEIGKLHEKMVKTRAAKQSDHKPIEPIKGDMTNKKTSEYPNIDQRIIEHERQKRRR